MRVYTANTTNITAEIVQSSYATEITFANKGTGLEATNDQGAIRELSGLKMAHISRTPSDGVHGIKLEDGRLQVFDGKSWKIVSAEDDLNAHDASGTAHESRFSEIQTAMNAQAARTMPIAPTGAVHAAIGAAWHRVEDMAMRSVIMVSEGLNFTLRDNRHVDIPPEEFDLMEVLYIPVNGALARFEKYPLEQTRYAVGRDFEHYRFDYDGANARVTVTRLGIAASNPNILHNGDLRNPVNQLGLLEYIAGYTVDRWRVNLMDVSVRDGSISLEGGNGVYLEQPVEFPLLYGGMTMTASADVGGIIYSHTFENVRVDVNAHMQHGVIPNEWRFGLRTGRGVGGELSVRLSSHANTTSPLDGLRRVKLELGPVSTLANDPPADFGAELAKCRRFFQAVRGLELVSIRVEPNNNLMNRFSFAFSEMRVAPALAAGTVNVSRIDSGELAGSGRTPEIVAASKNHMAFLVNNTASMPGVRTRASITTPFHLDANL